MEWCTIIDGDDKHDPDPSSDRLYLDDYGLIVFFQSAVIGVG